MTASEVRCAQRRDHRAPMIAPIRIYFEARTIGAGEGSAYFDASTIGPVGADTPASGSSVTANTFTGLPSSTAAMRCVPRPEASTLKRPAGCGAPSPMVHISYALPAGAAGRLATNTWPPLVGFQMTRPVASGLGPRPLTGATCGAGGGG